jgi:hypothetical protein
MHFVWQSYRMVVQGIAQARKLRFDALMNKPRSEQLTWLKQQFTQNFSSSIIAQVLQVWLMSTQQQMLCSFLDSVGCPHDERGQTENLPGELGDAQVSEAVKKLLQDSPAEKVAVYLHLFQAQRPQGWSSIAKAIDENTELKAIFA